MNSEGAMLRNILVIEDNPDICDFVSLHLRDLGYAVELQLDGEKGLLRAMSGEFQLIILDLMLPGVNGLDICRQLRADLPYVPILMLTAKSSEVDRIVGLETGADDYLTKPFSIHELLARVKAIFRRIEVLSSNQRRHGERLTCGELEIDLEKRKVQLSGTNVELTANEFDLLTQFAANPGTVLTPALLEILEPFIRYIQMMPLVRWRHKILSFGMAASLRSPVPNMKGVMLMKLIANPTLRFASRRTEVTELVRSRIVASFAACNDASGSDSKSSAE